MDMVKNHPTPPPSIPPPHQLRIHVLTEANLLNHIIKYNLEIKYKQTIKQTNQEREAEDKRKVEGEGGGGGGGRGGKIIK